MDALPSMADAPFHCPPDVVLELPPPISVNKLRRINWREHKRASAWREMADRWLLIAKTRKDNPVKFDKLKRFEMEITLSEDHVHLDLDNSVKLLIDYLRHRDIIEDDSKIHMRKLTVTWGFAPAGCLVVVKPCEPTVNSVLQRAAERAEAKQ